MGNMKIVGLRVDDVVEACKEITRQVNIPNLDVRIFMSKIAFFTTGTFGASAPTGDPIIILQLEYDSIGIVKLTGISCDVVTEIFNRYKIQTTQLRVGETTDEE